jgi:hypothetical protein
MTATVTGRRRAAQPFVVLQWRQTWRIVDGIHYREAEVRTVTGEHRLYAIRDAA